jgi:hypothetical protein
LLPPPPKLLPPSLEAEEPRIAAPSPRFWFRAALLLIFMPSDILWRMLDESVMRPAPPLSTRSVEGLELLEEESPPVKEPPRPEILLRSKGRLV